MLFRSWRKRIFVVTCIFALLKLVTSTAQNCFFFLLLLLGSYSGLIFVCVLYLHGSGRLFAVLELHPRCRRFFILFVSWGFVGGGVSLSENYKSCLLCWREQVGSAPENLFTHPSAYNYTSIRDIIIRSCYHGETQTPSHVLN